MTLGAFLDDVCIVGGLVPALLTVDFLIPPAPGQDAGRRVQNLEPDFGALVTPGLELAFDERVHVELDGHTLNSEPVRRTIPVCGPGAFVILKALGFGDRGEPKDAYDLAYVIRNTIGRGPAIAGTAQSPCGPAPRGRPARAHSPRA